MAGRRAHSHLGRRDEVLRHLHEMVAENDEFLQASRPRPPHPEHQPERLKEPVPPPAYRP